MKKQIKTILERASTGVFFWLVFTALQRYIELQELEYLVFFVGLTVLSPLFIGWVAKDLK